MDKPIIPRIENMTSESSGREIPNQFRIWTDEGVFFQSYRTLIAFRPVNREPGGPTCYLSESWDYSRTTGKYRNQFLRETKKETEAKIRSGEYQIVDWL